MFRPITPASRADDVLHSVSEFCFVDEFDCFLNLNNILFSYKVHRKGLGAAKIATLSKLLPYCMHGIDTCDPHDPEVPGSWPMLIRMQIKFRRCWN